MPTITEYKVSLPGSELVDYVSIQYAENYAVSMPKSTYDEMIAQSEANTL